MTVPLMKINEYKNDIPVNNDSRSFQFSKLILP